MPKMKSHSGAGKRVRLTGTGKIVRRQSGVNHLLEHKPGQRRRRQQRDTTVAPADTPRLRRMLGA